MPGTLVRKISGLAQVGYGVNIWEQPPPGMVTGVASTTIAVVALLPWGPEDVVTDIGQAGDLFNLFAPAPFDANADYPALKAFTNVSFPGRVKVVRVGATGAAKATSGALSAGTGSITLNAKYKGLVGNDITYDISAGTVSGKKLSVEIGTGYSVEYDNLAFGDWAGIDDPYFDVVDAAATANPADVGATAMASGSDGAAIAADLTGGISSDKGIQLFAAEAQDFAILYVAACPEALKAAVNTGLYSFVTTYNKGMVVLSTIDGQSAATAETYVASHRADRAVYPWPRVKMTDRFDPSLAQVEVDGAHFAAVAMASVDPELSPGGANGAPHLGGIADLETFATSAQLDALKAAGVACWFIDRTLGAIIRGGVTTSVTSGREKIFRRRMADFCQDSLAARLSQFAETKLDVDLTTRSLGPNTSGAVGEVTSFLQGLLDRGRVRAVGVDPYSENTQNDIDSGQWTILVSIQLYGAAEAIVLKTNIGEFVTVLAA